MSKFTFRFMTAMFAVRDIFSPPERYLHEAGVKPGCRVLDFGCGPGSYSIAAAKMAGKTGTVYAVDIHPFAVESVRRRASKKGLANIEAIRSDCDTGLDDKSIDVVLLYDVFHALGDPDRVLRELHRALEPGGVLSFTDHHMREHDILSKVTASGLFELSARGKRTYTFIRRG